MEAWKDFAESRVRNQISNILLFGSIIALTASGLVLGTTAGVLFVGRTSVHSWQPVIQLLIVVLSTVAGFSFGVFLSLLVSPVILRFAFFATKIGEWNGTSVYTAADADLPGRLPNVFVSGFSFAVGPLKPAIFVAEGAIRILPREALQAVFAHEMSHLECHHLTKRVFTGILTFVGASFLTAIMLIGLHWSGYTEIGGIFSVIAGILPAVLTWMAIRQQLWNQELEADANAIKRHQIRPENLISALEILQRAIGGAPHPLVATRLEICRAKIKTTIKTPEIEEVGTSYPLSA
jgi:Zn-dependent protease with chaperone function